ncbi:hypothetical protein T265_00255 [Opisthorchis viverrini]|uniref:FFD box profile domain-containing protein n=1 Tax=Opisthorchis viverrini TaxID=6198 RepID=A0A075A3Z2_OPIVI|nr:hypothetical protein T265_00255 [Opisthorchis viverrini]KER34081.1 hypothetical protein T265_00255 [Opisthorchis viverrini]
MKVSCTQWIAILLMNPSSRFLKIVVWSFGTEDRPCERPVAPRNEEYNQVVFRGRDLEDVRLVQSSVFLNEDSAIVSAAPGTSISNIPGSASADKREDNRTLDLGPNVNNEGSTTGSSQHLSLSGLGHSSARPAMSAFQLPAVGSRPGPIGTQQADPPHHPDSRGPRPFGDGRSEGDTGILATMKKLESSGRTFTGGSIDDPGTERTVLGSSPRTDSSRGWSQRDPHARGAPGFHRGALISHPVGGFSPVSDNFQRKRGGPPNQWPNAQRGLRFSQPGYLRRGSRAGGTFGWSRPHSGIPPTAAEQANFSGEYDYEKANAELAAELEKINISVPKSSSSVDGDASKSDEVGGSVASEDGPCYDKTKSFFDTLSSEMMDKANGVNPQGLNRRDERLLNSATFGTVPPQFVRRGGYHAPRATSGYGGYSYGQRRTNGGGGTPYHVGLPSTMWCVDIYIGRAADLPVRFVASLFPSAPLPLLNLPAS